MATYLIAKEITIIRKAGDVADIVFTVPQVLPLAGRQVSWGAYNQNNTELILKTHNDMTIDGQQVTIPLKPEDTNGHHGTHVWELVVTDDEGPITIGKGDLIIQRAWLPKA